MEHAGKDNKSHMLKHTLKSGHLSISPNYFRILQKVKQQQSKKEDIGSPANQKTATFVKHTCKFRVQ